MVTIIFHQPENGMDRRRCCGRQSHKIWSNDLFIKQDTPQGLSVEIKSLEMVVQRTKPFPQFHWPFQWLEIYETSREETGFFYVDDHLSYLLKIEDFS